MSLRTIGPEGLMTCPLDEAHRIIRKRMQFHLVRCIQNHTYEKKLRCPWNVLHFVERCEYLDHCHKCDNLVNIMSSTISSKDDASRDVASIPISAVNAAAPTNDEDWDADPCVGTYDPLKQLENRPILRASVGLSKAKKREFKQQERRRHQRMDDVLPVRIESKTAKAVRDTTEPRRLPRAQPFAISTKELPSEDAQSGRTSDEGEKYAEWPAELREPHKPSPGLMYEGMDDVEPSTTDCSVKLFDIQFEASGNVRAPTSSSGTRRTDMEVLRKLINAGAPKRIDASNNTNNDDDDDDNVDELTQQLANLETAQKSIEEKKAAILQQMSERGRKSANFEPSVATPLGADSSNHENRSINRKCAANLGTHVKLKDSPLRGFGRGIAVDSEAFKNSKAPGKRGNVEILETDTKENVNPFVPSTTSERNA